MTTTESTAAPTDLDKKLFRGPRARFANKNGGGPSKADQIRQAFDEKNKSISANIDSLKNKLVSLYTIKGYLAPVLTAYGRTRIFLSLLLLDCCFQPNQGVD